MLYCGWDGGGTKTEVCLMDGACRRVASRVFGPLNPNGASRNRVPETVRNGVQYMKEQAGGTEKIGGLVIGMAGISNRGAAELVERALEEAGWRGKLRLAGDQEIALAGAVEGSGLLLIAGTGSVLCGRDREGRLFRVGGYGYLIDDAGSGWAIGRDILTAVVRGEDGRGPATALRNPVFEKLNISTVGELITWLYAPETGKGEVASLAELLPGALERGDEAAEAVARQAGADLAEMAETGWRKSGLEEGEIAFSGSILLRMPRIRSLVEERLERSCPRLHPGEPRRSPAEGAARMAVSLFAPAD